MAEVNHAKQLQPPKVAEVIPAAQQVEAVPVDGLKPATEVEQKLPSHSSNLIRSNQLATSLTISWAPISSS